MLSRQQIEKLAKRRSCPRCNLEKTEGTALCRRCRFKLPSHMRLPLEGIVKRDESVVASALRAAANYFDIHYKSIRYFGGGRLRCGVRRVPAEIDVGSRRQRATFSARASCAPGGQSHVRWGNRA